MARGLSRDTLPLIATAACTVLALLLFITGTASGLREQRELEQAGRDFAQQIRTGHRSMLQFRSHVVAAGEEARDLQALLVAIDRLGLTPVEILDMYPGDDGPGPR